jgi:hypothetical protein
MKISFQISKVFFQFFSFQNFLDGTNEIFNFLFLSSGTGAVKGVNPSGLFVRQGDRELTMR